MTGEYEAGCSDFEPETLSYWVKDIAVQLRLLNQSMDTIKRQIMDMVDVVANGLDRTA
jgi:hypothetical protein